MSRREGRVMDSDYCRRCGSRRLENKTHCFECIDILEDARQRKEVESERDRLAAENADWKAAHDQLVIDYEQVLADLEVSDATLDALRDVCDQNEWERAQKGDVLSQFRAILNPQPAARAEEKANGD